MKKKEKFAKIRQFLLKNADPIQKEATRLHKKYLGSHSLRTEFVDKYQNNHIALIHVLANNLENGNMKAAANLFRDLGEKLAKDSVQDGLTLEEAIDGTIFLKQAIWTDLKREDLLKDMSVDDYYEMSQKIGTFIDTLSSKIAFTYHRERLLIERNLIYLAEASRILSSSLDYQTTLNTIAVLAVPEIGDWCTIELLNDNGELKQVAIAHKDPKKIKWAKELRKVRPPDMNDPTGTPNVLRTGKSEIYPSITDDMLVAIAKNKKDLKLLRKVKFTSAITVPIFSQKSPIGTISFVTSDTKRHYNPADLVMAEELGLRASIAIENAKLYKGSQEAISLRDDFIAVASHELKTPVTSVKMFTQILKKHSEQIGDQKAADHLSKMDRQINKLTELIYDLLNISKIQAGRLEFKRKLFNFDKAVDEIMDILQQSKEKHKLVIKGKTDKKIFGDEERIGQVLENLISNAIKYSPKADKVVIRLSAKKDHVKVAVQDFGIGMQEEHLGKIFERFYRVYDTTDKTFPGLGIGLYISSEIIKHHGGKFWVKSNIGQGSTFYFSLPEKRAKNLDIDPHLTTPNQSALSTKSSL